MSKYKWKLGYHSNSINTNAEIPYLEPEMSRFTRFFSGKFQYLGNCAGVKHLTNIMSDEDHCSFVTCSLLKDQIFQILLGE